jgi:hypothetical protein
LALRFDPYVDPSERFGEFANLVVNFRIARIEHQVDLSLSTVGVCGRIASRRNDARTGSFRLLKDGRTDAPGAIMNEHDFARAQARGMK